MPPRVAATFGMADFIAAEDTRVTLRLLNHLGLKKPMVSYYEHALHHGEAILNRIEAGAGFIVFISLIMSLGFGLVGSP